MRPRYLGILAVTATVATGAMMWSLFAQSGDAARLGYFNFNHHEPKAPTAKLQPRSECAYCHQASAKKDEVWTQFYPLLDK